MVSSPKIRLGDARRRNLFLSTTSYLDPMAAVQSQRRKAPRHEDPELRGRRSEPRAYLLLPASVEALDGRLRISLLDVSPTGARVEGTGLPAAGKDVILRCGKLDTFGTIVWSASDRCGIHFDEPVPATELIALRSFAVAAERAGVSPEELQAAADWANGLAR